MNTIRVYADTSVFGGVHDIEFKQPSLAFFGTPRVPRRPSYLGTRFREAC